MPTFKRHKTSYPGVYYIKGISVTTGKEERIYYIMYRKNGKLVEEKAGRQFQDDMTPARASNIRASRINCEQLTNKEQREAKKAEKSENENLWTLNRLFQLFLEIKSHLKSLKDDKIRYRLHLKEILGKKEVEQISPFEVERIRISMLKTHKPATVKQVLVLLKRIVNFGVGKNLCHGLNFKVEMPKFDNRITEDMTDEQYKRFLTVLEEYEAYHPDSVDIMRLALFTGMRKGEILGLMWDDVDFDRGFILIRDPKGIISQSVPMNDRARVVLVRAQERRRSEYVFPNKKGGRLEETSYQEHLRRIRERAGLPKSFRPMHGLRHTFASSLASSGQVDLYTLQRLLTHKSPQMTQRYAHLRDDAIIKASKVIDSIVERISPSDKKA